MTAQAEELLFFNGEEMKMAATPLAQYLEDRKDIHFSRFASFCWRGYFGQWEIKDNKLFLIGLTAYIEHREVDLNYLFPGQKQVFANWVNGKIRIPQGELLDYVHMGYASLYEKDLFLVFENGVLVKQYEVDNAEEYQERLKLREKWKKEEKKEKRSVKIINFIAITILVIVFIGICIGIFYLIKWGTILGYIISAILASGVMFLVFIAIRNRIKK